VNVQWSEREVTVRKRRSGRGGS